MAVRTTSKSSKAKAAKPAARAAVTAHTATATRRAAATKVPKKKAAAAARRPRTAKWVYSFEEGNASMRDLLGGKGAGVAEMTRAGLPVPPRFTITTAACNEFYRLGQPYPGGMW